MKKSPLSLKIKVEEDVKRKQESEKNLDANKPAVYMPEPCVNVEALEKEENISCEAEYDEKVSEPVLETVLEQNLVEVQSSNESEPVKNIESLVTMVEEINMSNQIVEEEAKPSETQKDVKSIENAQIENKKDESENNEDKSVENIEEIIQSIETALESESTKNETSEEKIILDENVKTIESEVTQVEMKEEVKPVEASGEEVKSAEVA